MYSFIDKPFLSTKLLNLNPKSGQILCIHKPYFLMPGYIYVSTVLDNIMCMCCVGGEMHCSSVTTSVLYAHIYIALAVLRRRISPVGGMVQWLLTISIIKFGYISPAFFMFIDSL